jgi:hypothetical protein
MKCVLGRVVARGLFRGIAGQAQVEFAFKEQNIEEVCRDERQLLKYYHPRKYYHKMLL